MKIQVALRKIYSADLLSPAACFSFLLYFLAVAIAFYFSFGAQKFWNNRQISPFQVRYVPTGQYLFTVYNKDWTNNSFSNSQFLPVLDSKSTESSPPLSLKVFPDRFFASIQIASGFTSAYQYQIMLPIKLIHSSTPNIEIQSFLLWSGSFGPAGRIDLLGTLQAPRLQADGITTNSFFFSPFKRADNTSAQFSNQILDYINQQKPQLSHNIQAFFLSQTNPTRLSINLQIQLPAYTHLLYKPTYSQTLKNNWVQFFSVAVLAFWVVCWIQAKALGQGLLKTTSVIE